ncbi:hypothetical protein [Sphingomonas sp. LB2R24]|uniref:hypothetical protein n=1 Tax=Sphingomonas sorbitolis TaxID=3096165 RepID=UPI002FC9BB74
MSAYSLDCGALAAAFANAPPINIRAFSGFPVRRYASPCNHWAVAIEISRVPGLRIDAAIVSAAAAFDRAASESINIAPLASAIV